MSEFKLVPYTVRIKKSFLKEKGKEKKRKIKFEKLNELDINGENLDFYDFFLAYLKDKQKNVYHFADKTLFVQKLKIFNKHRLAYGIIQIGESGFENDFYDKKEEKHIPKARKEHHSEMTPFFFMFHSPLNKNPDTGFLILLSFENKGIKSILNNAISKEMGLKDETYSVQFNPLISEELLKKLKDAEKITEIKLIAKEIPKDIADKVYLDEFKDIREMRSFKTRSKEGLPREAVEKIMKDLKNVETPYLEITGEKYEKIKIVLKEGKGRHTLTLGNENKFQENYSLPEEFLEKEGGYPKLESTFENALEYLNIILGKYQEKVIKKEDLNA